MSAFIPGNSLPSRYSKNAPPAVETKLKELKIPILFIRATVSPPPATEKISFDLFLSAIFFPISKLPFAKFGFSKYPAGPFHKIVLLNSIILFILFIVFGPISKIISSLSTSLSSLIFDYLPFFFQQQHLQEKL